jgi:hypothetical protein
MKYALLILFLGGFYAHADLASCPEEMRQASFGWQGEASLTLQQAKQVCQLGVSAACVSEVREASYERGLGYTVSTQKAVQLCQAGIDADCVYNLRDASAQAGISLTIQKAIASCH